MMLPDSITAGAGLLLFLIFAPLARTTPLPDPAPQLGGGATLQEATGQVTINDPHDEAVNDTLPIRATIFHGVPGPKDCRGGPMNILELPAPATQHAAETCYDLDATAGCGRFQANKADGCQARLFAEAGCSMFVNTAVFLPQFRAVGGNWRSMAIRCAVPEPDPSSLGMPPLAGMITKQTPKEGKQP